MNFDGASKGNPGKADFGCVIRDHDHNMIRVICGPLGACNATQAESNGLLMGLREIKRLKLRGYEVEGDPAVVISWGKGTCMCSWELALIIYEIRELMSLLFISLVHVDRSRNELADKLAN